MDDLIDPNEITLHHPTQEREERKVFLNDEYFGIFFIASLLGVHIYSPMTDTDLELSLSPISLSCMFLSLLSMGPALYILLYSWNWPYVFIVCSVPFWYSIVFTLFIYTYSLIMQNEFKGYFLKISKLPIKSNKGIFIQLIFLLLGLAFFPWLALLMSEIPWFFTIPMVIVLIGPPNMVDIYHGVFLLPIKSAIGDLTKRVLHTSWDGDEVQSIFDDWLSLQSIVISHNQVTINYFLNEYFLQLFYNNFLQ